MSRARSALAVRATKDDLIAAALSAFGFEQATSETKTDYDEVIDFCRENSEELGGTAGFEAWYVWTEGDWTILGDLSLQICRNEDALTALSEKVGEIVVTGIDSGFEYAFFAYFRDGDMKRLLILEDDELVEDGFPVKAERGRYMEDFAEEQALELWTSYGMKTLEFDPTADSFTVISAKI